MTTTVHADWRTAVLLALALDPTPHRVAMLGAWGASKIMPAWCHNPTACGLSMPGSVKMTDSGVQAYRTYESGINAVTWGLNHHDGEQVRLALIEESDAQTLWHAIRSTSWPWVEKDDTYPSMVGYIAAIQTKDAGRVTPPTIWDGLHGGYPRADHHEYALVAARTAEHAISMLTGRSRQISALLRKGNGHG